MAEKRFMLATDSCGHCADATARVKPLIEKGEIEKIVYDPGRKRQPERVEAAMEAATECDDVTEECSVAFPTCLVEKDGKFQKCESPAEWEKDE